MVPSIDHSLLSPSGRMSARARKAAIAREAIRLFPPGTFPPAAAQDKALALRRHAVTLRELASRGMSPRKHLAAAARLEAEAAAFA